jgi:hypothetical protein
VATNIREDESFREASATSTSKVAIGAAKRISGRRFREDGWWESAFLAAGTTRTPPNFLSPSPSQVCSADFMVDPLQQQFFFSVMIFFQHVCPGLVCDVIVAILMLSMRSE